MEATGSGLRARGLMRRRRERGALMIDALVALSFFGVILGTWAAMTNAKSRVIGEADRRFRAVQAAESALAEARDGARGPGPFTVPGLAMAAEVSMGDPRADGLREVTVSVRWREPGGPGEEGVTLSTLSNR